VNSVRKDIVAILLLLLVICIAYWPLAFNVFSLKNDALNYFLPVRFQVSEAIYNHHYPFWSPYFNLGYALHGDMQSGVWNPIVQFFSLFGPYTLYRLQLETLLYIFLSGAGMYILLRQTHMAISSALFASAAYMLCGFNSDCCQYLNWISSAAFLPLVVLFYYKTLEEKKITRSLAAGFFLYMMFVSAYPAHFVVTLYLLAAILIHHLVRQYRTAASSLGAATSPLRSVASQALFRHLPMLICFIVLSSPAILSYMQYLQLSERGDGTTYHNAMTNPLHPLLLLAYLTPLPIHAMPHVDITDQLERNSYFGIITFIFALASFFIKTSDPWIKFSRIAFVIFQVMSLGEFGGLRPLTYYTLPLMSTFRHPSSIKLFTIFFGCILAAYSMQTLLTNPLPSRKIKNAAIFSLTLLAGLILFSLPGSIGLLNKLYHLGHLLAGRATQLPSALKDWLISLDFKEMLFADSLLQLGFVTCLLFLLLKKKYKAVVLLSIINCMVYVMFFAPFTVIKKDYASSIQHTLDQSIVKGYPLPSLTTSLADNSKRDSSRFDEIGCLNMYNKLPGRNDYRISPCNLLSQNEFWFDVPFRKVIMNYPVLYRPDTLVTRAGWQAALTHHPHSKIGVIDNPSQLTGLAGLTPQDAAPTPVNLGPLNDTVSLGAFEPGYFRWTVGSAHPSFYILLQNNYPLWKLYIDGKEQPITPANISFMGIHTPTGIHTVELKYHPSLIIQSFWFSLGCTILLLLLLTFAHHRIRYIFP
jgi:hypothetical protein